MNTPCATIMCFLLVPVTVLAGSHTLTALATYVTGEKAFSATIMLDDITVGYYNSETKIYVARGNNTNEDDVVGPDDLRSISENVLVHFIERSHHLRPVNNTESESHEVHQVMGLCEQNDNKLGQIISKSAYGGLTVNELHFFDGKFTYQIFLNYTQPEIKPDLELSKLRLEKLYYPACIKTLKNYLKKRQTQLNRKVKPQVRFIQKKNSDSGVSRLSCLATGFYPRHINLTLFRDGRPVADHEISGGDLLPNDDGTYQMRKSLEISVADKHKYTCSATHLDNKCDIDLEDHSSRYHIGGAVCILLFVCAICVVLAVAKWIKRQAGRPYPQNANGR